MSVDSAQPVDITTIVTQPAAPEPIRKERGESFLWRNASRVVSTLGAWLACTTPVSAVLVVGWILRLMQRRILLHWWQRRQDPTAHPQARDFLREQTGLAPAVSPARMMLGDSLQARAAALRSGPWWRVPGRLLGMVFGGLWPNLKRGLGGILAVGLVTWPIGTLWIMSWHAGWHISFHKVYEESTLGVTTGIIGILLYTMVMLYLPMAQAHQAAAGDWTAFFQFRIVRRLILRRGGATLLLAVGYAFLVIPVNLLLVIPMFMPQMWPEVDYMTVDELLRLTRRIGLLMAAVVLPAYLLLRLFAARVYAGAMLDLLRREPQHASDLSPSLRQALDRLGHIPAEPARRPHRVLTGMMKTVRLACIAATVLAWIGVASQLYVVEFLNYHGPRGWLNHPLIQIPWTTYIPPGLRPPR